MSDADSAARRRGTLVALLVAGAFFMENLDGTVIATALPQMAASFHTTPASLASGMTAYLLTLAVFIPASGWAADRFGAQRVFACAIALFTLASILCGASRNPLEFTVARVLQGCGGAMMTPVGRLVVMRRTAKHDLMRAVATLTWPALVAPVVGPPIGGFITQVASWRWIFFINVPLGVAGLILTFWLLRGANETAPRPFDAKGFALNGLGLASLLYALDELGQSGADWRVATIFIVVSAGLGWLALRHARTHRHPIVSFDAFSIPTFKVSMTGGFVSRSMISTVPFLLPLLFQLGLGLNPFLSGLLVLWYGFANIGIKPATSWILRRFGFRNVLLVSALLSGATIAACGAIGTGTPVWFVALLLLLAGASRSMTYTSLNGLAFADVPSGLMAPANTVFNTSYQLSTGMGIALGAIAFRIAESLLGGTGQAGALQAFHCIYPLFGVLALLPLLGYLALRPDAGALVSGHPVKA